MIVFSIKEIVILAIIIGVGQPSLAIYFAVLN